LPIGSLGTTITGAFWVEPWADQLRLNIRRSSNVGLATHCRTLCVPIFASRLDLQRRILASAVPSHSPTTEELLKRAEDLMREDCAYLKDFNAAVDALQKGRQSSRLNTPLSVATPNRQPRFQACDCRPVMAKKICSRS